MIAPVLKSLFRKDRDRIQAETLHAALAEQARAPEFFTGPGAPDTPEGRFDMLALHMFLAIERLRRDAPQTDRLVRLLQEVFFERLDSALREMGVGDLSVGRKIRGLAEAFYGRLAAYERGFAGGAGELEAAIARNVLGTGDAGKAASLATYMRAAREALQSAPIENLGEAIKGLAQLSRNIDEREAT